MRLPFIVLALLSLEAVITIHELGHFTLCKIFDIDTPTFSVGFGPTLIAKQLGKTTFRIAAIPVGGYVEIAGMDHRNDHPEHSFFAKPFYQKAIVLLGGIFFNFLAAYLIFLALLLHTAERTARLSFAYIFNAFLRAWFVLAASAKQSVTRFIPTLNHDHLGGPLHLLTFIVENVHSGLEVFFTSLAFINISVALFNLLPLPILDGGKFIIVGLETLQGHPFSPAIISLLMNISFLLLALIIMFLTMQDLRKMR